MEEQDVHDDGREDRQTERHIAPDHEQQAGDDLQQRHKGHVLVRDHDAQKDTRIPRHGRHVEELQDVVEAKEDKDEAQQNPRYQNSLAHT